MKYRLMGLLLALIGMIEMFLLPEDATAGFFIILLSMCLIFGKQDRIKPV